MLINIIQLSVLFSLPYSSIACMKTAEPATTMAPPTTAAPSVTTTAASSGSSTTMATSTTMTSTSTMASTTTAAGARCGDCLISLVQLANDVGGEGTPIQPVAECTAPGMMTVSCTAAAGSLAAMEVNPNMFVPGPATNRVDLPLVCNNNVWVYMGATTVTLVACSQE